MRVTVEATPNPNARRFLLDRAIQEQPRGRFYTDRGSADEPLARALLEVDGVAAVLLLPDSITVTKSQAIEWELLEERVRDALGGLLS